MVCPSSSVATATSPALALSDIPLLGSPSVSRDCKSRSVFTTDWLKGLSVANRSRGEITLDAGVSGNVS